MYLRVSDSTEYWNMMKYARSLFKTEDISKQTTVVPKLHKATVLRDCLRADSSISCPTFTGFVGSALMRFCTCAGKPTETNGNPGNPPRYSKRCTKIVDQTCLTCLKLDQIELRSIPCLQHRSACIFPSNWQLIPKCRAFHGCACHHLWPGLNYKHITCYMRLFSKICEYKGLTACATAIYCISFLPG